MGRIYAIKATAAQNVPGTLEAAFSAAGDHGELVIPADKLLLTVNSGQRIEGTHGKSEKA